MNELILKDGKSEPLYIRLPKPGQNCPKTGLTRSHLNRLILACPENDFRPLVKSIVVKQPGTKRGVRLIVYRSLLEFIAGHAVTNEVVSGK